MLSSMIYLQAIPDPRSDMSVLQTLIGKRSQWYRDPSGKQTQEAISILSILEPPGVVLKTENIGIVQIFMIVLFSMTHPPVNNLSIRPLPHHRIAFTHYNR